MAEIPTFQAGHIDARAYAGRSARNARLVVDGKIARLVPLGTALAHPPGAAGLRTTRLEVILAGPALNGQASISYRDDNYKDRIGWKEIVIGPTARSTSDELRAYPKNLLQSPLDITSVRTELAPTGGADVPPGLSSGKTLEAPDRVADAGFSSLIGRHHLSALVILASLAAAFFWGMAHALSPGHGKTIVAAYLVGRRGTPWHAAALGAIVTATHTIGLVAVFAKQIFKRASFNGPLVRLLPAASALVILAAGLAMTVRALPKVS